MTLPHLIHVGFPKCGSTYLQRWFGAHPEIAYCWDSFGGERGVRDFLQGFVHADPRVRCRVTSDESLIDPEDPSTWGRVDYDDLDRRRDRQIAVAHELARRYPDVRILMVTRNHADLLRSGYSELVRQGGSLTDVEMCGADPARIIQSRHADYDAAVHLYRGLFGDRLLVLPMEWLADDSSAFMAEVAAFAGVSPLAASAEPANPSLSAEQLYWLPRIAKLLYRFRPGRFRPALLALHIRAIRRGWWDLAITLIRLVAGRRVPQLNFPPHMLEAMSATCHDLVTLPHHAAYRDRYLNRQATAHQA